MKTVQSLTLVMAVMVYAAAAPTPTTTPTTSTPTLKKTAKELLGEIKEEARILKNETTAEALEILLPRLTSASQPTCVTEFFCLAEKALKKKETKSHLNNVSIERLTEQLHQYNKTDITCSLPKHGHISLKKFLGDIEECCEQRIIALKQKL